MDNKNIIDDIINSVESNSNSDYTNEFLNDFLLESKEYIDGIEQDILELEQNPENDEIINNIFRNMHSLKGLSGFVAQVNIEKIAHITENLLSKLRKKEILSNCIITDLILKSVDYISKIIQNLSLNEDNMFIDEVELHLKDIDAISNENKITENLKIGEILENDLRINKKEIDKILFMQKNKYPNLKFGEIAILEKILTCEEVAEGLEKQLNLFVKKHKYNMIENTPKLGEILKEHNVLTDEDLKELVKKQNTEYHDKKLGEIAIAEQKATLLEISQALKKQKQYKTLGDENINNFYVRLPIDRIDNIVNMIGELMILNSQIIQDLDLLGYQNSKILRTEKITKDLQLNIMKMRMVTLKNTFQKIRRIGRDCVVELNKDVDIEIYGAETEIDRDVAEKLLTPLTHIVKNAIAHGIETNDERNLKQKSEKGRVVVEASSKRGNVYIKITDNGKGLDIDAIYKKAREKKLIIDNKKYSDEEIMNFIFLPNFSTKETVDKISGRGVGLDVVRDEMRKIDGNIEISSKKDIGTEVILKIPINLVALNGTVVKIGSNRFIIPTNYINEILSDRDKSNIMVQGKEKYLRIRDKIIEIVSNEEYIGVSGNKEDIVIILEIDHKYKAIRVDDIVERREVVIKQVGEDIGDIKFVAGASIMGDGQVSLIIDVENIFK